MNLVEWLLYGAALEEWRGIGGLIQAPHYEATRQVTMQGDFLSGYRNWSSRLRSGFASVNSN